MPHYRIARPLALASLVLLLASCGGSGDPAPSARFFASVTSVQVTGATAKVSGTRAQYTIQKLASGYLVSKTGTSEKTTLDASVTRIEFTDVAINLTVGTNAQSIAAADLKLLVELYIAFFNRVPDGDGLEYWIKQYKAGASMDSIAQSFYDVAVSMSALTGYTAAQSNADFVRTIYANVLGRSGTTAPPDADVNYWANLLATKQATRGSLIRTMLGAAHGYTGDATWGWVAQLLDNKYTVGQQFAVQQGVNYYSSDLAFTRGKEISAAVTPTDTASAIGKFGFTDSGFNTAMSTAPVLVSLIGLNDFHGNLVPFGAATAMRHPTTGATVVVPTGGIAYLATLVNGLKAQNPNNTLVVSGGDMIGASPIASGLFHDESSIEALSQLGLDLVATGNHEFDDGRTELLRMQNGGCYPKNAAGTQGIVGSDTCMTGGQFAGAKFKYLSANVIDNTTGKPLFPAYEIRTVGGVDIPFIGLTLRDTPTIVTPAGVAGLSFNDEVATVNGLVPELKAKGVSSIVVLIHQGGSTSAATINDKTCPNLTSSMASMVDQFDKAVDVVVSGHTHTEYVCTRPDGKILTQAGYGGQIASKIDLTVDPVQKKVIAKEANNYATINDTATLPSGVTALAKDAAMDALVQRYVSASSVLANSQVGTLQAPLTTATTVAGESRIGDVVADIYLAATSGPAYGSKAAQIAFTNPGGLRASLTSQTVTYGNLFSVLPFANYLVTMDLTGNQILRLLEQQWETPNGSRVLQVSNGFEYSWSASAPANAAAGKGARVVTGTMKLNGVAIDMNKTYRVTVNNFMSTGGDNFTVLLGGTNLQSGDVDIDAAVNYFRSLGIVPTPSATRITRAP